MIRCKFTEIINLEICWTHVNDYKNKDGVLIKVEDKSTVCYISLINDISKRETKGTGISKLSKKDKAYVKEKGRILSLVKAVNDLDTKAHLTKLEKKLIYDTYFNRNTNNNRFVKTSNLKLLTVA